ncbi:hypothetical protein CASFOL_008173 [Castilleja foliolosa]|uniref:UBX domain-containing protein n=1 Tax=Castilleja foliolosa TaxID=1961234 RepID=A0ABD3DY79_9LAMI
MARPHQEAIDTFISITGVSEADAIKKLEENHGNLNAAVNAHFTEGDRNIAPEAAFVASQDDVMDVDDPIPVFPRDLDPFSLPASRSPFVSHPREVREVPIEFKDGIGASGQYGNAPIIEDATENTLNHGPEIRGIVISDDDDDSVHLEPSAPTIVDHVPDYSNEIEEEMIRAAIEASKHDIAMPNQDVRLTAEKENALRELEEGKVVHSELEVQQPALPQEIGKSTSSNGRQSQLEIGSSSVQDEADDVEELELVRHRRRRTTSSSIDTPNDNEGVDVNPPSSPQLNENVHPAQHSGSDFPSDEWGGISSVEHDEAVMLEAAMFGGIPEGISFHFPYTPRELIQNGLDRTVASYPTTMTRPPSPSLTAQRMIREQQDDEYLASLQADREKALKANEEAEAALAEERRKEDEIRRQLLEEQEIERQLAAKEASLPPEPQPDDENAVTLLIRMPDGNRRGRRFRKSDMLQYLFDFIDVGRGVKPGSYRLVRPYPRRAFGDGEVTSTLNELGLTSKQEALYLELI